MNNLAIGFLDGAKATISNDSPDSFKLRFLDSESGELIYNTEIGPGQWASPNPKYYIKWKIEIENVRDKSTAIIDFDCAGKKVWIQFDSKALGDT